MVSRQCVQVMNSDLLIAVHQDHAQLSGHQFPATVHLDVVTSADVLNVHWDTCILQ